MKKILLTAVFAVAVGLFSANAQVDDQNPVNQPPTQTDEDPMIDNRTDELSDTTIMEDEPGVLIDSTGTTDTTGTMDGVENQYEKKKDKWNDAMKDENENLNDKSKELNPGSTE